ncbi:MAG: YbaY family lipoprotein [Anaerolineae bacterium]|nr:YbaY family lipoprotein [Thermoflexales bacterium]MDW8394800.1 YbaY family lipoprotein [Anaerolineae bacterium]
MRNELALIISGLVATVCFSAPAWAAAPATLSREALANAEYPLEAVRAGKVKLTNGLFTDETANVRVQLSAVQASGDLNGDRAPDAAVVLSVRTSAGSVLLYLAAVLNVEGKAQPVASVFLGERIGVREVRIDSRGQVVVAILDRRANQPITARPTVRTSRAYALRGDALIPTGLLSADALANAEYPLVFSDPALNRAVPLEDSGYRDPRARLTVRLNRAPRAFGDLNGDGAPDAAVVLSVSGANGAPTLISAVMNDNYTAKPLASALIGERQTVRRLSIRDGVIEAELVQRDASRASTQIRRLQVQNGALVDLAIEPPKPSGLLIFACDQGKTVNVIYDEANNTATVTFGSRTELLVRVASAPGVRYDNERLSWVVEGARGTLSDARTGQVLAANCAGQPLPASTLSGVITGTVVLLPRAVLPPSAVVEVRLQTLTGADGLPSDVAVQTFAASGQRSPLPFELRYDPARIDPQARYALSARVLVGTQVRWVSRALVPALTQGAPASGIQVTARGVR